MPVIFGEGQPGRVVVLQDPGVPMSAKSVEIDGFGGFEDMKAVITRGMVAKQGNFQFMHTLGDGIFLYTFGDRIGQIILSGLAFAGSCTDNSDQLGIEHVLRYYEENRISHREDPIRVTIGTSTTFNAYLGQISASLADPENRIFTFDMPMILIPEPSQS